MLRHMRRHDIWISEKLKFDYLKNEKSYPSEIKNVFPCLLSALFRYTKQTSILQHLPTVDKIYHFVSEKKKTSTKAAISRCCS